MVRTPKKVECELDNQEEENLADLGGCLDVCLCCGFRPAVQKVQSDNGGVLYSITCGPGCNEASRIPAEAMFHPLMAAWNRRQRDLAAAIPRSIAGWQELVRQIEGG